MSKYKLLSLLFFLLITINVYPVSGKTIIQSPTIKTLYVDDDAPPEWYNETHFKMIMDAINNSNDGDTIFVYNGTYYEKMNITKSIKLIGEDKYNTIIDGCYIVPDEFGATIIRIFKTDGVTVSGFTIQKVVTNTFMVDAGLFIGNSSYDNISNNIFRDIIDVGILIESESNHLVSENMIIKTSTGIWCDASDSTFTKNIITNIDYEGILLCFAYGNTFIENNITHTLQGMVILESSRNLIKRNNIAHNTEGVFLSLSRRNKFYQNNFIDSGYAGHVEFKGWSFLNHWRGNYWDNQIIHGVPKILFGRFGILLPWLNFDFRPAREPYNI